MLPLGYSFSSFSGLGFSSGKGPIIFGNLFPSVTVLDSWQSDRLVTLNGSTVSAWAGTKNGNSLAQAVGGSQPTWTASDATLNGKPSMLFDGTDDTLTAATPDPASTSVFIWGIAKQVAVTAGRSLCGAAATANRLCVQQGASPDLVIRNSAGAGVNSSNGGTVGSWFRMEAWFLNAAADYLKCGAVKVTGAAAGNGASTGVALGSSANVAATYANCAWAVYVVTSGLPTAAELAAADLAAVAWGGPGVLV